jgi:gliding motility-associated-like protein
MKKILLPFLLSLIFQLSSHSQCSGDVTFTLDTPPAADFTYPPNTVVELCVTMTNWNGNAQGSNWLEGFGLTLGTGWINVTPVTPPNDADNDASGTWIWVNTVTSDVTGLTAGPGYFFEGPTGPTDGNPGNDWGDYCMNGDCVWEFCVSMTASGVSADPLDIEVTPYSDGTMGSWGTEMCFDPPVSIFDGEVGCTVYGCTNPIACNFDPNAGCDDGSCNLPGCTDPVACNYDLNADCDDGSCTYPGCTDPLACNFVATAGCDDGSCDYFSMTDITHNFIPCPDTTCTGSEVMYSVNGDETSIYDWHITGGGLVTTDQTSSCEIIWGNIPGTYTITVQEITERGCIGDIKTCDVEVIIPDITFDTTEYTICLNGSLDIIASPSGGSWSSEYMNLNTFIGTRPGTYNPQYTTNIHGCNITESVKVKVKSKYDAPPITFASEYIDLCLESGEAYYLTPDSLNYTYSWFIENAKQPESSNQLFTQWPDTSRVYLIKVIGYDEIGCESEPSLISIKVESCQRFFAPNSFTPNGDGTNDVFELRGMSVYQPTLKIFDRWGYVVYQSNNLWWTGDCGTGYYCNTDVYNWIIEYRDKDGFNKEERGFVTLVR